MGPRPGILEEDEEVEEKEDLKAKSDDEPQLPPRAIVCPECTFEHSDGHQVGMHLERHRPMGFPVYSKKGKLLSTECPRGCKRFFNRGPDVVEVSDQGTNNAIKELSYHIQNCDGSSRLPTSKEEEQEMAKRGRSFKSKDKPSTGPNIEPCPLCPEETFATGHARGAHYRTRHPDWKTDPRFNPSARKPEGGDEGTLPAPEPALRAPTSPVELGDKDDPIQEGKRLVTKMRLSAIRKRELVKTLTEEADNLEATADAMEKALED